MEEMLPIKPYLVHATYEWIVDNDNTPYISVDTNFPQVRVPSQFIKDNNVLLDISDTSADQLLITKEALTCQARFGGIVYDLYIPIPAINAIYAQENNQGMNFPKEEIIETETPKKEKPKLKVISGGKIKHRVN